ncbi:hypothetical protein YC2023_098652 [Brassica napus]
MIQSPKPAKPVLHLPQLEANRFNQPQPNIGDQDINIYIQEVNPVIQKSSTSSYHAPANIGSGGSPLTPTCLFWRFLPSSSNSSFSFRLGTTSAHYKQSRRIQREILCCSIDFVSIVFLCKSNKLSIQIERANHFVPSYHQIERFNQALIRNSTSSPSIDQAESLQLDFNHIAHPIIYLVDLSKPQAIHTTSLNLCLQHFGIRADVPESGEIYPCLIHCLHLFFHS